MHWPNALLGIGTAHKPLPFEVLALFFLHIIGLGGIVPWAGEALGPSVKRLANERGVVVWGIRRCRRGIDWVIFARNTGLNAMGTLPLFFIWCVTLGSKKKKVRMQNVQYNAVMYLQLLLAAVNASHGHVIRDPLAQDNQFRNFRKVMTTYRLLYRWALVIPGS